MMSTNLAAAFKKLRAVTDEFFDALEHELNAITPAADRVSRAEQVVEPKPERRPASRPAPPPKAPMATGRTPPPPPTPPRAPGMVPATELSDETRAASFPDAMKQAERVVAAIGRDNAKLLEDSLRGQLAISHIPFDDQLVRDVLAQALG